MRYERSAARRQAEGHLEVALVEAARTADKHESKHSIVRRVFNESPEFFKTLGKPWFLERMVKILEKLMRRAAPDNQLVLPGIKLPPVIRILKPDPQSRKKQQPELVPLLDATLPQLRQYRKELVHKLQPSHNRQVQEVDKAIGIMERYAPRSRKATLREVFEKHGQEILFEYKTLAAG